MQSAFLLISLVSTIVAAGVMSQAAPKRGRRAAPWVVLTVVIGWLAFIPLFIAPKKNSVGQVA
jgi:hypothetical protein